MIQIIDASVALKWVHEESGSERAREVLFDLQEHPKAFAVPELFYFEMEAILLRLFIASKVSSIMDGLIRLGIYRYNMDLELAQETAALAEKYKLTGYDASYVALATLLKGKWITFDHKASVRLQHNPFCKYLGP